MGEWYIRREYNIGGWQRAEVCDLAESDPLTVVCETSPSLARQIVADHNAARSPLSDLTWSELAERACRERDAAVREHERLREALEEIHRGALAVVGASEAYGETESAHLWNEMAAMAEAALWPKIAQPAADGRETGGRNSQGRR